MTKEEIIEKHKSTEWRQSGMGPDHGYGFEYLNKSRVGSAMDQWAIQFGIWIHKCNYAPATEDGKWQNQLPGENDIITTEQLYDIFWQSNQ